MKDNAVSRKRIILAIIIFLALALAVWIPFYYFGSAGSSSEGAPVINEVLCSNSASFKAYDGRFYDWIELYNPSSTEVTLNGYYISDDPESLTKNSLSGQSIPAKGYLVIYCSGLNMTDERGCLHTNFKLSAADGETVYLSDTNSVISVTVPPSKENVSYGLNDEGKYVWFDVPSPGDKNGESQSIQQSDVRINEYMIANTFTIYDCEGDFGDWVELCNTSKKEIDISDYGLTDEEGVPDKYVFPKGTKIQADGYLLVFCDGKNKTDSKGMLHTSFSLSAKDGSISLYSAKKALLGRVAIRELPKNVSCGWDESSGEYRFFARPTPGKANTTTPFKKLSEKLEQAPGGDVIISEVLSASAKSLKTARNDFVELYNTTSDAISLKGYTLSKKPGEKTYTFPDVKIGGGEYLVIYCDGKSRVAGGSLYSSVKISTGGDTLYLADSLGAVCDVFSTGKGRKGVSSGRVAGDLFRRYFFTSPSPGKANGGKKYLSYAPVPTFSVEGGVIKAGTTVSLLVPGDYTIVYTTDGTEPTKASAVYRAPFRISRNTVIRAAAFSGDSLISDSATQTYLTQNPHTIPIFCISGDPAKLTEGKGIFVDKSDSSEYKIHAEYFTREGVKETEFPCGVKLFGHSSREMPQKGVKLMLREIYGMNEVTYPFFIRNEHAVTTFSSLLLRPSGEDQIYTKLRDELIPALVRGKMDLDYEEEQPCALYINGEYWGFYYVREALNADYLKHYYGYEKGDFDLIKGQMSVQEGSSAAYRKLIQFCKTHDLRDQKNYEVVKKQVDFDSLINYWIIETYFGNTDTVNIRCYKHRDGKWRWMVYDMDWSMQTAKYIREKNFIEWHLLNPKGHGIGHFDNSIIRKLLENEEFRDHFLTVYTYHLTNTFAPERSLPIFDELVSEVEGEIKLNEKKWRRPAYSKWKSFQVPHLRNYLNVRPGEVKNNLKQSFHLSEKDWERYVELSKNYHPEENAK